MRHIHSRIALGETVVHGVRMPVHVKDAMQKQADDLGRSLSSHIVAVLSASLTDEPRDTRPTAGRTEVEGKLRLEEVPPEMAERIVYKCRGDGLSPGVLVNRFRKFPGSHVIAWADRLAEIGAITVETRTGENGKTTRIYRAA